MNVLRIACTLVLPIALAAPAQAQVSAAQLLKSGIIFTGVVEDQPPPMTNLPAGTRAVSVQVDEIMVAPPEIVLGHGDRVTVAVGDPAALPLGNRFTFYTEGWIFADTLAVREIAHEAAPPVGAVAVKRASITAALNAAEIQSDVNGADAVIVGTVMSVAPLPPQAAADDPEPISEHDPKWTDAEVQVDEWLKGGGSAKRMTVRFPASIDVAWYDVPKLRPGMRRLLFLHHDAMSTQTLPPAKAPADFVLFLPTDAQPPEDAPLARQVMR